MYALERIIAEKVEFLYQTKINPDTEITITPGGTYAIYSALTTILQPGDEVIIFEPAYDSYIPNVEINGAKAVTINLVYPEYKIDWACGKKCDHSKNKSDHDQFARIIQPGAVINGRRYSSN